uniref:Tektin n=1 Tax=Echinostoma caproni TaxID=27848 RepID=A0A183ARA7_9TREM
LDRKISGLNARVMNQAERASTPKRNSELPQSDMKGVEDRMRSMVYATQTKLDERLQALTVELKQLEAEVHEQTAKMAMDQLGFRKLCNKVAQDVSTQLGKNESRIPQVTRSHGHTSRADELKQLTNSIAGLESKLNSLNQGTGEQSVELERVLAAEIKIRRSNESQLNKLIKQIEDRVDSLTRAVNDAIVQANRVPTPVTVAEPISSDVPMNAIKNLYRKMEQIAASSRRQYADLSREVLNARDNVNQLKEALHKMVDFRVSELKDQFMLLHNEIIQLQVQPTKGDSAADGKPVQPTNQSMELRKLAESLFTIKLALLMKIRLLEKREKEEHDSIRNELQKLSQSIA